MLTDELKSARKDFREQIKVLVSEKKALEASILEFMEHTGAKHFKHNNVMYKYSEKQIKARHTLDDTLTIARSIAAEKGTSQFEDIARVLEANTDETSTKITLSFKSVRK